MTARLTLCLPAVHPPSKEMICPYEKSLSGPAKKARTDRTSCRPGATIMLRDRHDELRQLDAPQLREIVRSLMGRLKGHDPSAYLNYVLERLPRRVQELLPHRWQPTIIAG